MQRVSHSFYVYYRVEPTLQIEAREAVQSLLTGVKERSGCQGRWLAKVDEPGLWMEVYEDIDDPVRFKGQLYDCLELMTFERFLAPGSRRHLEHFATCA